MANMDMTQQEIQNLKDRLRVHENNLRVYELQRSKLGINIDIQLNNSIINEIDEINKTKSQLYSFKINKIDEIDVNSEIYFIEISSEYLLMLNKLDINIAYYYDSIRTNNRKYYECYDLVIDNLIHCRNDIKIISDDYSVLFENIDIDRFIKKEIIDKIIEFVNLLYFDSEKVVYEYTEGNIVDIVNRKAKIIKKEVNKLLKLAEELNFIKEINDVYYLNKIFIEYIIYKSKDNNYLYKLLYSESIESRMLINKDIYEIIIKNNIFINIKNISDESSFLARNYSLMVEYSNFMKDDFLFSDNYIKIFPIYFINEIKLKKEQIDNYLFNTNNISISRYLISNADFKRFIDDNAYNKLQFWSEKGKVFLKEQQVRFEDKALFERGSIGLWNYPKYWFHYGYNHDLQPVVGISYYEAEAYCNWLSNKGNEQGWLDSTEEIRLLSLEEWINMMDHEYPDINDPSKLMQLKDISTLFDYPYCINCFSGLHENVEVFDIFGNVWEWTSTNSENADVLSFYTAGGSFRESLQQIRDTHQSFAKVVHESQDNKLSIADTVKAQDLSLESNIANRQLPNLGFRIVRALKKEFLLTDQEHLLQLLAVYKRNKATLELQTAQYGGLMAAPLQLINQMSETNAQITHIEGQLSPLAAANLAPKPELVPSMWLVIDEHPTLDPIALQLQLRGLRVIRANTAQEFHSQTKFTIASALIGTELLRTNRSALQPYLDYLDADASHQLYLVDNSFMFGELEQIFGKYIEQVQLLDSTLMPNQLAKTILEDVLEPFLEDWDSQKSLDIDIFSYQQAEYDQPALLCIDTRKLGFEPADWESLMQALYDLREVLNTSVAKRLAIRPMNSRLSVAMAFGAVFSSTANFELRVAYEQRAKTSFDLQTTEWWQNHNNPAAESLPKLDLPTIADPKQDAIVGLSVARNVYFAAQEYIEDHELSDLPFFGYSVTEPGFNAVTIGDDGRSASAIANQFGQLLRTHRDTMSRRNVWHFFYALPVALAVFVGQELNACTPIQCYEFMNDRAEYIPSCLIKQN
ncbi:SAVED domain-containing protein [Herpetosiphon llansteffanensis]|uniref:SAVED domain-containing protein n=1 Tax=Herpetosiphon llansteffanensis TaxID=2094568 RepID=UPI000D7C920E|nr:SAVED domain-containing protein [Herpetosiphon llansteffanensis]